MTAPTDPAPAGPAPTDPAPADHRPADPSAASAVRPARARARGLRRARALTAGLGVATAALAGVGATTLGAQPEAAVRIVVDGAQAHGISQATVDAALDGRTVPAWRDLTLRVTAQPLPEQWWDAPPEELDADVVVSTAEGAAVDDLDEAPAVLTDQDVAGHGLEELFGAHLATGQGPSGVVAVAEAAGRASHSGLPRQPLLWIGLVLGGLALTLTAAMSWARRARDLAELRRRLRAARLDAARVVLDLDAVEVSYEAVPPERRTPELEGARRRVQDAARRLAAEDEALAAAVERVRVPDDAAWDRVAAFHEDATAARAEADALVQASEVAAGAPIAADRFDDVAAALVRPAQEALAAARTADAAGVAVPARVRAAVDRLDAAVTAHLALLEREREEGDELDARRWSASEDQVRAAAAALRAAVQEVREGASEEAGEKAASAGTDLDPHTADGLAAVLPPLDAMAAEPEERLLRLRRLVGLDGQRGRAAGEAEGTAGVAPTAEARGRGDLGMGSASAEAAGAYRASGGLRAGAAAVAVTLVALGAWRLSDAWHAAPWTGATVAPGASEVEQVRVEGLDRPRGAWPVSEEALRETLRTAPEGATEVVVAHRRAEDHLDAAELARALAQEPGDGEERWQRRLGPGIAERIKAEHPELLDRATGELADGRMIQPVLVADDGTALLPPPVLSAPLADGVIPHWWAVSPPVRAAELEEMRAYARSLDAEADAEAGEAGADNVGDDVAGLQEAAAVRVASAVQMAAEPVRGLSGEEVQVATSVDRRTLFWVLALGGALTLIPLGALVEALAGLSAGLRGRGRAAVALQAARTRLEGLMVGLDDRLLHQVAVLGAGPAGSAAATSAQAGQRLYESALVAAWREAEHLAGQPWALQRRPAHVRRAEALLQRVEALGREDRDVARRAEAFLRGE